MNYQNIGHALSNKNKMQSGAKCTQEQQVQDSVGKPKITSKYIPKVNNMNKDKGKTTNMKVDLSKDTPVTFNQDSGN